MKICVYGLWHLGCVTAACLAGAGFDVVGLDDDEPVVRNLQAGNAPVSEPGLDDLLSAGVAAGKLHFTVDARAALAGADVLWVTFDTPVNDRDEADVASVRNRLEAIADAISPGTLVLVSSQVPAGFTKSLEDAWTSRRLVFAVSPENLRLGKALDVFRTPDRVIVGLRNGQGRAVVDQLFSPFTQNVIYMSIESAEMTKHAINAFLATSVTFINEIARICEEVGADAKEVERGLKSEARIGPKAYLGPGAAFAGGTLARDLRFLVELGDRNRVDTPVFEGVIASNDRHKDWLRNRVSTLMQGRQGAKVAVLGLTYKPGTNTLRRSSSVELCRWLAGQEFAVQAHDPAIETLPEELTSVMHLHGSPREAMKDASLTVIATEWPVYRTLTADDFVSTMREVQVIDQTWFLVSVLGNDARVKYLATGRG